MPQAAAEKEPLAIRFKLARRFYEPILLDAALKNIGGGGSSGPQHEPNSPEDSIDNAEEAFQCFVNRLADVCDNGNFGKTVSAVAVLEEFDCVHYIVGSNMREATGIEAVKSFVKKLLELVGSQGDPSSEKAGLKKMLLSHVLHFNQKRVERYATRMAHHLQECIKDHERRYPENHEGYSDDAAQSLKAQLIPLLQMTQTPTDEQPGRVGLSFFARFDALLQHIHHLDHDAQFKEAISEQAQDGKAFTRQPWIEFKHYFGRLKSYRLAIDTIIHVGRRSPILFQDVRVTVIPSAKPGESVFKGSKTKTNADGIIGRMLSPGPTMSQAQIQTWKDRVAELQKFGLDKSITRQIQGQDSLIVHAEILVLDFVLGYMSRGGTVGFWKGWKYIGSSKPTCRLCHYYMAAHPSRVKVRKSHGNIYPSWRVPDAMTEEEAKSRDLLLNQIVKEIRQDVLQMIESKQRLGRVHDSNSNSQLPAYLRMGQTDDSTYNLESHFSALDISSERGGVSLSPQAPGSGVRSITGG